MTFNLVDIRNAGCEQLKLFAKEIISNCRRLYLLPEIFYELNPFSIDDIKEIIPSIEVLYDMRIEDVIEYIFIPILSNTSESGVLKYLIPSNNKLDIVNNFAFENENLDYQIEQIKKFLNLLGVNKQTIEFNLVLAKLFSENKYEGEDKILEFLSYAKSTILHYIYLSALMDIYSESLPHQIDFSNAQVLDISKDTPRELIITPSVFLNETVEDGQYSLEELYLHHKGHELTRYFLMAEVKHCDFYDYQDITFKIIGKNITIASINIGSNGVNIYQDEPFIILTPFHKIYLYNGLIYKVTNNPQGGAYA